MASSDSRRPRKMRRVHSPRQTPLLASPAASIPSFSALQRVRRQGTVLAIPQASLPASLTAAPPTAQATTSPSFSSHHSKPFRSSPPPPARPSATGLVDVRAGAGSGSGKEGALGQGSPAKMNALTLPGRELAVKPWGLFVMSGIIFMIVMLYFIGFVLARSFRSDFRRRLALQKTQIAVFDVHTAFTPTSPPPHPHASTSQPQPQLSPPILLTEPDAPSSSLTVPRGRLSMALPSPSPSGSGLLGPPRLLDAHPRGSVLVADGELDPSASGVTLGGGGGGIKRLLPAGLGGGSKLSSDFDMVLNGGRGSHHQRSMSHPHSHHRSTSLSSPISPHPPAPLPGLAPTGFSASRHLKRGSRAVANIPAKLTTLAAHLHTSPGGAGGAVDAVRMQKMEKRGEYGDLWDGAYEDDDEGQSKRGTHGTQSTAAGSGQLSPRKLFKALPGRSHLSSFGTNASRRPPVPPPSQHSQPSTSAFGAFLRQDPYASSQGSGNGSAYAASTPGLTDAGSAAGSGSGSSVLRSPRSPPLTDVSYRGANPWLAQSMGVEKLSEKGEGGDGEMEVSGPLGLMRESSIRSESGFTVGDPLRLGVGVGVARKPPAVVPVVKVDAPAGVRPGVRRANTAARAPMMGTMPSGGTRDSSFFPHPSHRA